MGSEMLVRCQLPYSPVQSACHKCLLLGATDKNRKTDILCGNKSLFYAIRIQNRHVYAERRLKETVGGGGRGRGTGMGGWVSGWVNARGRRQKGGRRRWWWGRSHSFTHNFLETEWGCLHKAKNKSKQNGKNKKKDDGKKRFCCRSFPCVRVEDGGRDVLGERGREVRSPWRFIVVMGGALG